MISPIYIIVIALGTAFLLPLLEKNRTGLAGTLFFAALLAMTFIAGQYLFVFMGSAAEATQVYTAGFKPPFSINLRMGREEAALISAIDILALAGAVYLFRHMSRSGVRSMMLYLVLVMSFSGIIMTRDIFNLFVFMELAGIASYALVASGTDHRSVPAAFKYALAGGIASIFMLLGIIFLYRATGTLNIDGAVIHILNVSALASPVVFLLVFAFMIEMKQFPANSWALDVYETAHPGISALLSAGGSLAVLYAVFKILPIAGTRWYTVTAVAGMTTFFAANVAGIMQKRTTRLLGYSSVAQMGLLLAVTGFGLKGILGDHFYIAAGGLALSHLLAKAGLFWLAGSVEEDSIEGWKVLAGKPVQLLLMGIFLLALAGFPPFPGFYAKWSVITALASARMYPWMIALLAGSLFEVVYLFRWFGISVRGRSSLEETGRRPSPDRSVPTMFFGVLLAAAGYFFTSRFIPGSSAFIIPLAGAAVVLLMSRLDSRITGVIAIAAVVYYGTRVIPGLSGMQFFFAAFFIAGSTVVMLGTLYRKRASAGFYPVMMLLVTSLTGIALAGTMLQFFFYWEIMTVTSYFLVLRGRDAQRPALKYMIFSAAGAYLIMAGFAIAIASASTAPGAGTGIMPHTGSIPGLADGIFGFDAGVSEISILVLILLSAGFLIKLAVMGVHIWAPGSYAEAEDDVSALLSGILSKAGIAGFVILLARMSGGGAQGSYVLTTIGWIGTATALLGAFYAAIEEDAKKLLAWSSIGQVGYIILGLSAMSHLGWVAALYHSVNHFMFKGLLFLAVAGVVYRTGTRKMYEMGGLIKKMPLSFVSVMIGIIALSGVPPLTGFGGKWLLYNALVERGWYLQAGIGFFSSTVAFLYCFRLIHAIFLGQPKPAFRRVVEAPKPIIAAQYILIIAIMAVSTFPGILVKRLSSFVEPYFASTLRWEGATVHSSVGYWNGTAIMMVVGAIFAIFTVFLLLKGPRPRKVKQFNMVFAAERPETPETTHYAYRFFTPYERAFAPLLRPVVRDFWNAVAEWASSAAAVLSHFFSGDAQTCVIQIMIFGILLYFVSGGGVL